MNAFRSTRGDESVPFAEALRRGLAPDGGLYVPERIPPLPARAFEPSGPGAPEQPSGFGEVALRVADAWLSDAFRGADLRSTVASALDFPVPLVEVEPNVWVMELFHGPSLAFKDVGARFMARATAALSGGRPATVLVATSGDTGGAVAAAFHGLESHRVVVLFPKRGISERQRRQMTTLGGNVRAVAVDGTFDDCQRLAKEAFADEELRVACGLTSANSINIGRLLPQAFYYVHAAERLDTGRGGPRFFVPSGNLGNLCAGLMAQRAGLGAAGFVAALNPNRVFADYLETGRFSPTRSTPSLSNAMDVGSPSNLERIRSIYGEDVAALRADVAAVSVSDGDTLACMRDVYRRTGYLLDPHTAVAWAAMERSRRDPEEGCVVLATAHPAKFPDTVARATGVEVPLPPALARRLSGRERMTDIAPDGRALRATLLQDGSPP